MIDKRIADVIREVGRETDTPQDVVQAVIQEALPSIRLVPQFPREGESPRLGSSRIGGLPDLPEAVSWPRLSTALKSDHLGIPPEAEPLWFLMQINLAEVAFADVANELPKSGMFYFFFHGHPADQPSATDAGFVLFHKQGERDLHRNEAPPDMHPGGRFQGCELLPRLEWTVPACHDTNYHLKLWESIDERVAQTQGFEAPWGPGPIHRMLGHPEVLQFWRLDEGQKLLLQVSSDCPSSVSEWGPYPETGMMWGDVGRIYFLISKTELQSQCFGNVWAHLECQ